MCRLKDRAEMIHVTTNLNWQSLVFEISFCCSVWKCEMKFLISFSQCSTIEIQSPTFRIVNTLTGQFVFLYTTVNTSSIPNKIVSNGRTCKAKHLCCSSLISTCTLRGVKNKVAFAIRHRKCFGNFPQRPVTYTLFNFDFVTLKANGWHLNSFNEQIVLWLHQFSFIK